MTFGLLNRAPTEDAHDCNVVVLLYLFLLCSPFISTSASALSLACCLPTLPPPSFCFLLCIYFYCFCLLHQSTSPLALSSLPSFPVSKSIRFYCVYRIKCLKCWFDPEIFLKDLKAFFQDVTVAGFVYKPIIFPSLAVFSSRSMQNWSSRKTSGKLGTANCLL